MAPAIRDGTALPVPSIVGWFSPLPWLECAGDSVVPDGCHRAREALQRPLAASGVDAQNDNTLATTPDERTGEGTAVPSPRFGGPVRLLHVGWSNSPVQ